MIEVPVQTTNDSSKTNGMYNRLTYFSFQHAGGGGFNPSSAGGLCHKGRYRCSISIIVIIPQLILQVILCGNWWPQHGPTWIASYEFSYAGKKSLSWKQIIRDVKWG